MTRRKIKKRGHWTTSKLTRSSAAHVDRSIFVMLKVITCMIDLLNENERCSATAFTNGRPVCSHKMASATRRDEFYEDGLGSNTGVETRKVKRDANVCTTR